MAVVLGPCIAQSAVRSQAPSEVLQGTPAVSDPGGSGLWEDPRDYSPPSACRGKAENERSRRRFFVRERRLREWARTRRTRRPAGRRSSPQLVSRAGRPRLSHPCTRTLPDPLPSHQTRIPASAGTCGPRRPSPGHRQDQPSPPAALHTATGAETYRHWRRGVGPFTVASAAPAERRHRAPPPSTTSLARHGVVGKSQSLLGVGPAEDLPGRLPGGLIAAIALRVDVGSKKPRTFREPFGL